jgi:uncharacterized protein (DUF58 family)
MKPSRALRWLLAVTILFNLAGWAATGLYLYARIAYLGILLGLGAGVWVILSLRGIHLARRVRSLRASMGDVFEERFEIESTGWLGTHSLEVMNQSDLPLAAGSRVLTRLKPHQKRIYVARTPLTRRGAFILGPTLLASGDPFGLFLRRIRVPAAGSLVVLPMSFPISSFPPPPGILPGGKSTRQKTNEVTPHSAGVREYVAGDPMKRIHWPSTAKRGEFMVKEFEQDPQAEIWLFLDGEKAGRVVGELEELTIPESGWWLKRVQITLPKDSFEYGVSVAASLARHFLADRRAVGLACAAGKFTVVPAENGDRQLSKLMETLAFLQSDGEMPLAGLVELQARNLPLGSGVILITSSPRPELLLAARELRRRSLRPMVVYIRPETFGGEPAAPSLLSGLLENSIPVCEIAYGQDLGAQLALPAAYFQRSSYQPYRI